MNDINYIECLIDETKKINSKIITISSDNYKIISQHNNISNTLNSNISSIHKNINESYDKIQIDVNYFYSLISQYNSFSNIIFKIKQTNNYYENKIIINNKLLEKNNKIIKYICEIYHFCNYRDILQLINSNITSDYDINNEKNNFKFKDSNEPDTINNLYVETDSIYENEESIDDEYYKTQLKYYSEIEDYIKKIGIDNSNYNKEDNEINFQVDKDIKIMKELINIIKNRAYKNKIALEKNNDKILNIIHTNKMLYEYLYNFNLKFTYFNINFNNFFQDKIPKLDIFTFDTDNINQIYFDNFYNLYQKLISYSNNSVLNSVPFSFKLSKLKSYFNSLHNFFDINKLNKLLLNFEDKVLANDLLEIFQNINTKFDFVRLQKNCDCTIDLIDNFVNINKNNIEQSDTTFSNLKFSFYENFIKNTSLKDEYKNIVYQIIEYTLNNNSINEIKYEDVQKILTTKKYINNYNFQDILKFLKEKNSLLNSLDKSNNEKIKIEEDFIKFHRLFEIETNSLQYLLLNNGYESNENIIEKNKQVLNIETKIIENIENLEIINYKITDITDSLRINKKTLQDKVIDLIKYHV
jgi:hypothetical protein